MDSQPAAPGRDDFWLPPATLDRIVDTARNLWSTGYSSEVPFALNVGWLVTALAGVAVAWRRRSRRIAVLFALAVFAPFVLAILISWTVQPVLLQRTLLPVVLPFLVAIGVATGALYARHRVAGLALAAVFVAAQAHGVWTYFSDVQRDPWRDLVATLVERHTTGEPVLVVPNSSAHPLAYYFHRLGHHGVETVGLPCDYPCGPRGEVWLTPDHAEDVHGILAAQGAFWLVIRSTRMPVVDDALETLDLQPAEAYRFRQLRLERYPGHAAARRP